MVKRLLFKELLIKLNQNFYMRLTARKCGNCSIKGLSVFDDGNHEQNMHRTILDPLYLEAQKRRCKFSSKLGNLVMATEIRY